MDAITNASQSDAYIHNPQRQNKIQCLVFFLIDRCVSY